tara:strand:- start:5621 stop:6280 length:660 start_codon:yes stop_codon:yes gene_type:complete
MMTLKLVIFDCDGVLVDSEALANRELQKALAEEGLVMSMEEVIEAFVGRSMKAVVDISGQRLGRALPDDFLDRLQVKTFTKFKSSLKPVAGIAEVLTGLQDMPYQTCVASSGSPDKMDLTLGLTGLKTFFEGRIYHAGQVARGKPYPDLFLYAANQMGVDPAECLVVEDSLPGVQAAVAAGMEVLAYATRGQDRKLATAGGMVIKEMHEVIKYLQEPCV